MNQPGKRYTAQRQTGEVKARPPESGEKKATPVRLEVSSRLCYERLPFVLRSGTRRRPPGCWEDGRKARRRGKGCTAAMLALCGTPGLGASGGVAQEGKRRESIARKPILAMAAATP